MSIGSEKDRSKASSAYGRDFSQDFLLMCEILEIDFNSVPAEMRDVIETPLDWDEHGVAILNKYQWAFVSRPHKVFSRDQLISLFHEVRLLSTAYPSNKVDRETVYFRNGNIEAIKERWRH